MATSESERVWEGRSGRRYRAVSGVPVRGGRSTVVYAAEALGGPRSGSPVAQGARVAVREPVGDLGDSNVRGVFTRLARVQIALTRAIDPPPVPRVLDRTAPGQRPALITEWCELDLERWWTVTATRPEWFGELCRAMAALARAAGRFAAGLQGHPELAHLRPEIEPCKVLQLDGRWVFSGIPDRGVSAEERGNDSATELVQDSGNFVAPEVLFEARTDAPAAADVWSIGCTLFALLRMRSFMATGSKVPSGGTRSRHFRSHRVNLVADLHLRKPGLFRDRALDPRQFLYPDKLPDPDRRVVTEALVGVFGEPQPALEARLARETLAVLSRALMIDPQCRYASHDELAAALGELEAHHRELIAELAASKAQEPDSPDDQETQMMSIPSAVGAVGPEGDGPVGRGASDLAVEARLDSLEQRVAALAKQPATAGKGTPGWLVGLVLALLLGEAGQCALTGWWMVRTRALPGLAAALPSKPPVEAPPPAGSEGLGDGATLGSAGAAGPEVRAAAAPAEQPAKAAKVSTSLRDGRSSPVEHASTARAAMASDRQALPATGTIRLSGASGYLVGPSGKVSFGSVPAGRYEVWVKQGDAYSKVDTVDLAGGADIEYRCGFGICRRL